MRLVWQYMPHHGKWGIEVIGCPMSPGPVISSDDAVETDRSLPYPSPSLASFAGHCWALAGETLWDGTSSEVRHGLCVVMKEKEIIAVCPTEEASNRGLDVEFHQGCCLLPGLIDAHVHMEFSERHPLHQQPARSPEELHADMAHRALRMVRRGITTVRDLGGSSTYAAVKLRDEISAGQILGPRLLCAGQPITINGGHCYQWGGAVSSTEDFKHIVERQVSYRVDWIKVMATGGIRTPGSKPDQAQFSEAELREVVSIAQSHGLPVAAHAHATVGIRSAVAAGCRTIEHCSWIGKSGFCSGVDEDTITEMARKGVYVSPTAHANWARWSREGQMYRGMSSAFARLRKAGVELIISSDAGAIPDLPHDALAGAIEVVSDMARMTPVEALRAATSTSAHALGLGSHCGRLASGCSADVLVVHGDPLSNLSALRRMHLVIAGGRRVDPCEQLNQGSSWWTTHGWWT
jgi:imidazolonepropionase-like amidohydrolase